MKQKLTGPEIRKLIEEKRGEPQHWAKEFEGYDSTLTPQEKKAFEKKSKLFWERKDLANNVLFGK